MGGCLEEASSLPTQLTRIVCGLPVLVITPKQLVLIFSCASWRFLILALIQCISIPNPWSTCAYQHSHV